MKFFENDKVEKELYNNAVDAEFKYFDYIKNKLIEEFILETRDYVMDETHWAYKYFIEDQNLNNSDDISETEIEKIKIIYKRLSLICHPDKCDEEWSEDIFKMLQKAYDEKNIKLLIEMDEYWTNNLTFTDFSKLKQIKTNEELVSEWKNTNWFQWHNPTSLIRQVLIPKEIFNKKLQEEHDRLLKENQRLKKEVKLLESLPKNNIKKT